MPISQAILNPSLTPCRVVATTNQSGTYYNGTSNSGVGATFTYASGALTIDGVSIVQGDRVVLAAQTSAFQNGIYVCTTTGATGVAAVLQRASDFQCVEHMVPGFYTSIAAGSNNGKFYLVVEPRPATVGVSNITFVAN